MPEARPPTAPDVRAGPGVGARAALAPAAWPSLCAICRGWGRGRVCSPCLARFAAPSLRCDRCALPVPPGVAVCGACLAAPPAFDAALACVDYAPPWDRLITQFKFHGALDLAPVIAAALVDAAAASHTALPALLLPVPLAGARLRERGYNQAWEVARRIARRLGIEADATLLLRLRETAHQLALPPDARAGNVRGAFAVEPRRRSEVAGLRIALVDDVMTTGSTFAEIAALLKQAGAAQVAVWAFARTPRPGDEAAGR